MAKYKYKFEDLSNELIYDICEYLDAREVFQAFYNLNFRFKTLLHSINHLQLTVSLFDRNEKKNYEFFFLRIQTLIIDRGINKNLRQFKNLRRLILRNPKEKLFEQLNVYIIPHIEYLSITHKFITTTIQSLVSDLHEKIFSNHFPSLKSCNLSDMEVSIPIQNWQQSPSLYILKVGQINILVYKAILLACPNLYFLELKKTPSIELSSNIVLHTNLKYLIIKDLDQSFPWDDRFINDYLSYVPNLKKFTIHRSNFFLITQYMNYDWLSLIILNSLKLLSHFYFILHTYGTNRLNKVYKENMFRSLKEHFISMHKDRYQVRIKFVQN